MRLYNLFLSKEELHNPIYDVAQGSRNEFLLYLKPIINGTGLYRGSEQDCPLHGRGGELSGRTVRSGTEDMAGQ